jgi:hypothetical protein
MIWFGLRSDRVGERRYHTAIPLLIASAGIAASTIFDDPTLTTRSNVRLLTRQTDCRRA